VGGRGGGGGGRRAELLLDSILNRRLAVLQTSRSDLSQHGNKHKVGSFFEVLFDTYRPKKAAVKP
jgi:hypothetical protein